MKKLPLLLFLLGSFTLSLWGQTPEPSRQQIHEDQLVVTTSRNDLLDLEEKRLRLAEALAEGDEESAAIMRLEVVQSMEQQIDAVKQWMLRHQTEMQDTGFRQSVTESYSRLKVIRDELKALELQPGSREQAEAVSRQIQEFMKEKSAFQ